MMNIKRLLAGALSLAVLGAIVAPAAVAQENGSQAKRQIDKNNMRNLGMGLGAAAVHQAVTGKTTNALVLGAGAAYAGKKYEDARKAQRRDNRVTRRYIYRNGKRVGYYKMQNGRRIGYVRLRGA